MIWVLPEERRDALLKWCDMPLSIWSGLSIDYQRIITELEYIEWARKQFNPHTETKHMIIRHILPDVPPG